MNDRGENSDVYRKETDAKKYLGAQFEYNTGADLIGTAGDRWIRCAGVRAKVYEVQKQKSLAGRREREMRRNG